MDITLENAKKQRVLKKLSWNMRITGWISPYLIYVFSKLSIDPFIITFTWVLLSFVGFYFIALGPYTYAVIGIVIYHIALLLDSTDGGVARMLNKTNAAGEFCDRFFSTLNRFLILLVMGIGLYRTRNEIFFLYLGIWCGSLVLLDNFTKMKRYESLINSKRLDLIKDLDDKNKNTKTDWKFHLVELFRPANHFTLSFFAIIFGLTEYYLYVFSVLVLFQFLISFYKVFVSLKNTAQNL